MKSFLPDEEVPSLIPYFRYAWRLPGEEKTDKLNSLDQPISTPGALHFPLTLEEPAGRFEAWEIG